MDEIWKDVVGFENYYKVSNFGKVKSLDRIIEKEKHHNQKFAKYRGKILKPKVVGGYHTVDLCKNKIKYPIRVHRLVAQAFIKNSNNKPFINHKNSVKTDNYIKNLEWCTQSENVIHAYKNNRMVGNRKITEQDVLNIRKTTDISGAEIGRKYGLTRSAISKIKNKTNWKHIKS